MPRSCANSPERPVTVRTDHSADSRPLPGLELPRRSTPVVRDQLPYNVFRGAAARDRFQVFRSGSKSMVCAPSRGAERSAAVDPGRMNKYQRASLLGHHPVVLGPVVMGAAGGDEHLAQQEPEPLGVDPWR